MRKPRAHEPKMDRDPAVLLAAQALLKAHEQSGPGGRPNWQFAVRLQELRSLGVTESALRRLLLDGRVQHRIEQIKPHSRKRVFRTCSSGYFDENSCFLLTEEGVVWAQRITTLKLFSSPTGVSDSLVSGLPEKPHYDHRVLRWGTFEIIRFGRSAPTLERIIEKFEELGWPERIDDPLPPKGKNNKKRLRDAVRNLNEKQKVRLMEFHADGTGKGIRWQHHV